MIKISDTRRDTLPLYEVEELSLEEAMQIIAGDQAPDSRSLPEDNPTSVSTPAFNMARAC